MIDNLPVCETEPVQVVQEVGHACPELLIIIITMTVMDDLVEHQFASLPFWLSHDGVEYIFIFLVVHCVVDWKTRACCKFTLLVKQIVSLIFNLVQVTKFGPSHEIVIHLLLYWLNFLDLQHFYISWINAITNPGQPWFSASPT